MKKVLLILIAALLAFASCRKETPAVEECRTYALSSLHFDITIERLETKGIKSGWENGDKVFIFFSGVNSAYVTMSFNGTAWSSTPSDGEVVLPPTGRLTAVYLPYVGIETPTYTDAWRFASGTDSYFFKAEQVEYYIRDMESQIATLGAKIVMTKANDASAQFYVPKTPGVGETMQLACNVVTPTGLASIALDGTVTSSSGTQGAWLTGYPATVGGETGFYFYGMIADTPGSHNYFALKDNNVSYYKHYYKNTTLLGRKSYQLPDFDNWPGVGDDIYVGVGGLYWCSVNEGATSPLMLGTTENTQPSSNIAASKIAPSSTQWGVLEGNTVNQIPLTVAGVTGVLMVDGTNSSQYFFLPGGGVGTTEYWNSSGGSYFQIAANAGTGSTVSGTPASAYVRLIVNPGAQYNGGFNNPDDGGEL